MELTDALLAQIGAYLANQMGESERQAFEVRIRHDDGLQREVRLQQELKQGLALLTEKQRFKAMHTDLRHRGLLPPVAEPETSADAGPMGKIIPFPARPAAFRPTWSTMTIAASLGLFIGIGGLLFWRQTMPTPAAIQRDNAFYSVFTPDLKAAPPVSVDPDRLGATLPQPVNRQDSVRLHAGVSLLAQQQLQPAIAQLLPIAQGVPGHWRASAQWFLALAYLKAGQTPKTDSLLTLIADANGHPYQPEARQLISQFPHLLLNR